MFFGHGKAGNDNPIPLSVKFGIDPEPKHVYDPDKVKALLKKAGMENVEDRTPGGRCGFLGGG